MNQLCFNNFKKGRRGTCMSASFWEPTPLPITLYGPELSQLAMSNHISQAGKWILAIQWRQSRFKEDLGGLFQRYQKTLKKQCYLLFTVCFQFYNLLLCKWYLFPPNFPNQKPGILLPQGYCIVSVNKSFGFLLC